MKNRIKIIAAVIVLVCSLSVAVYPAISNYYSRKQNNVIITETSTLLENTVSTELEAERNRAKEYNKTLLPTAERISTIEEYENTLNVGGNGIMGVLNIPCIDVSLPIFHGTGTDALEKGVGHVYRTSLPVGDVGTHSVLSAHSGMADKRLFTDLDKLVIGDMFTVSVLGEKLYYKVNQIKIVLPHVTEDLAIQQGKDYVTLITCTPYAVNTHRLLVRGERFYPTDEETEEYSNTNTKSSTWVQQYSKGILTGILCAGILILTYMLIKKYKSRRLKNVEFTFGENNTNNVGS